MKTVCIFNFILQYSLISVCGDKPVISLSVVVPEDKSMWSLIQAEKALEMGENRLKEILEGRATVNIIRTISQTVGCSKYDYGALGARNRYVANISAFIGPGKYYFI
jgi:hypothetical protein